MPIYFLTWTTYGTWLHGDERGSVVDGRVSRQTRYVRGNDAMRAEAAERMVEAPFVMDAELRRRVDRAIRTHCDVRMWRVYALNVRSNHVHVVLNADVRPEIAMGQLKAWSSRVLRERDPARKRVWTRHGSTRWLNGESAILRAIDYVTNQQ